ncbi:cytoskeleton-associated protein 2 isoform X1 [Malaclemys terrapin pileata]|uniref:cytoskeleton-associated protein 2 isoform X1 n=1 Tax=Malaclemys terrapin pileata TaxID=2991368 RepID=UPI0023A858A3|nr:cytoskeleton-associated protein 2 isoform X1 [Malaclemys terrapin pileata]
MSGRLPPQLPATRRAEPAYREQRRQKVEEYLLRKKAISGLLIQEKRTNISNNRTGKAASDKLEDKIKVLKSAKQKMEDKENANRPPWTQSNTLKKNTASSKDETLKTTTILTNSTVGTNCSPEDFSSAINTSKDEAVEIKTYHVSFSQSFLHKRNIKEKQLIADKQNSDASLPKKHVPGSYCGKVIPSKINSFRKTLENEDAKSSLANKKPIAPATKPAVRPSSTSSNNAVINNIRATNLASAAKPIHATPFQKRPPVRASHSTHSKSIQNKEKQIVTSVSVNNMTVQKKPDRSGPPSLKTALHNAKPPSVPGAKRTEVPLRDVRLGTSAKSISVTCGTKATQDSKAGNRKYVLPKESTEERRIRLAEWKATKGKVIKRPSSTVLQVAQTETQTSQETPKEPVESFWATIVEEDEQGLFSENVNKTLVECLHLTEQGFPGDEVHAMLEKLIQSVPDAKKLAKYWVCRMRLEQLGPIEKIIAVYEEAILAGAQPKDELRHTVADIMKNTENIRKSVVEECVKEEVIGKEANSSVENVEEVFKELNLNDEEKAETSNEVIKKEETDSSLKSRQETLPKESKKHRTKYKEHTKKSENYKTEDIIKDANLEFKTPEKEKEGSYLIKYNLSTTPYLESVKKKMQCEANDSAVKDIKFLTPVRRSRRLQEKLCKLPDMLKDHDPCVSSLEQLGELGAVNNAFIYRQNSALQEPITHLEEQEE